MDLVRFNYMGRKPTHPDGTPARLGSLPAEIYADLSRFRDYAMMRERALAEMLGAPHRGSQLREAIIRQMMLHFAEHRILRVSEYQRLCARFASPPAVRTEISRLEGRKVLVLQPNPEDRRIIEVWPTQRIINWYKVNIPDLKARIRRLFNEIDKTDIS